MNEQIESNVTTRLVTFTEMLLTKRARRLAKIKYKQKKRGRVLEWVDAFVWAIMMVLLINQYLVQAYQIPSGSMRNTLIGGRDPYTGKMDHSDRIFVDKLTFGPELLPGVAKLPGFRLPRRGEIIIFENPEYKSPSIAHEIAQRVLYMATLSLVDLNRRGGVTAHQFLIKRQVAEDGDRILFKRGNLFIQPKGEASLLSEADFKALANLEYGNHLLLDEAYYDKIAASIIMLRRERVGLAALPEITERASASWVSSLKKTMLDIYEEERVDSGILNRFYPQIETVSNSSAVYTKGIYVPENWYCRWEITGMTPLMGDISDQSRQGKYWVGPCSPTGP